MKILLINCVLYTKSQCGRGYRRMGAESARIPRNASNHDCMIFSMARGFVAEGHEVTLLASEDYRAINPDDEPFETIYFESRMPRIFNPGLLPWPKGMRKWLRKNSEKYDLAISSEAFAIPTLFAARAMKGKTLIWQEVGAHQQFLKQIPSKVWHSLIVKPFMRHCRAVGRSGEAQAFISQYITDVAAEIVDHGADATYFHPGERSGKYFMIVSRLSAPKNVDWMIKAFADFASMPGYEDWRLKIAGDGEERQNLVALTESLGIAERVVFFGKLEHKRLAEIWRGATALLLATDNDLNCVSIAESIANGVPVLTNSVPLTAPFIALNELGIVKDGWGAEELKRMDKEYDKLHANCKRIGPTLTNRDCARRLVKLAP